MLFDSMKTGDQIEVSVTGYLLWKCYPAILNMEKQAVLIKKELNLFRGLIILKC